MARTRVQQSQISGSLSSELEQLPLVSGETLAGQSTLAGDLNALRSQVYRIIGGDNWYDALSGSQSLAAVYGALHVEGTDAKFQGNVSGSGNFQIGGDLTLDYGDVSAVSGTFSGGVSVTAGGLDVSGDTLQLTTNTKLIIDDLVQNQVLFPNASHEVTGSADFVFDSTSNLDVGGGNFTVGVATGNVYMEGDLTVNGNTIKSSTAADALELSGSDVEVKGDLKVSGNDIKSSDDSIAISLNGADVAVKGDLTVEGNEIKSTTGTVLELSGLNAIFKADVQVDGDLRVKGMTTYIDTSNMRVEDAFIYLATGSLGTTDSGIVLHGGAGAGMDLVIGQDGGAGEVIFGKGDRSPDGDGTMDGISLIPAWMSEVKLGGVEGSASGSLAASASGLDLSSTSGKDINVTALGDLKLSGNGATALTFVSGSGEYDSFMAQFPGSSLVAAVVAAGGNFKQDAFKPGATTAGVDMIAFDAASPAGIGASLRDNIVGDAAKEKVAMDVFLNGVRLVLGDDFAIESETTISLAMNTTEDDVLTVVIHNAAV